MRSVTRVSRYLLPCDRGVTPIATRKGLATTAFRPLQPLLTRCCMRKRGGREARIGLLSHRAEPR